MADDLRLLLRAKEKIFYVGKPDKRYFVLYGIFYPLPLLIILASIMYFAVNDFVLFVFVDSLAVLVYLVNIMLSAQKYKNRNYIVTDKAIYVSKGVFKMSYVVKDFEDLAHVELRRSIFDRMCGVGHIYATLNQLRRLSVEKNAMDQMNAVICISGISDCLETYKLVNELQMNVYSGIINQYRVNARKNRDIKN